MTDHSNKIFPKPSPETSVYWDGCRRHELLIQCCKDCNKFQFYPRIICTSCMSQNIEWIKVSGRAQVVSYTIVRRPVSAAYKAETPYVVTLVQLEEGPTMMSNIVNCDPAQVHIGMAVEVIFEDWSDEISMPKFQPKN